MEVTCEMREDGVVKNDAALAAQCIANAGTKPATSKDCNASDCAADPVDRKHFFLQILGHFLLTYFLAKLSELGTVYTYLCHKKTY